eukprot:scaffold6167_cov176-Pinguiococcus_pyrenoidosus.AAC.1
MAATHPFVRSHGRLHLANDPRRRTNPSKTVEVEQHSPFLRWQLCVGQSRGAVPYRCARRSPMNVARGQLKNDVIYAALQRGRDAIGAPGTARAYATHTRPPQGPLRFGLNGMHVGVLRFECTGRLHTS